MLLHPTAATHALVYIASYYLINDLHFNYRAFILHRCSFGRSILQKDSHNFLQKVINQYDYTRNWILRIS